MPLRDGCKDTASRAKASSSLCTGVGAALGSRAPLGQGATSAVPHCLPPLGVPAGALLTGLPGLQEGEPGTLMATERLLCAEHFHVSAPTVAGDATVVPVLERKKLRLREHSCLPKDTWLCGVRPRLWS